MEGIFTNIYENRSWGDNNNGEYNGSSGDGSRVDLNENTYIPLLKQIIINNNIKSVVDLGCGDFRCGNLIYDDLDVLYTGYDAYEKLVNYNTNSQALPKYSFTHLDFYNNKEMIKPGELYIMKDVLQHWSLDSIYTFLDYLIESKKCKYVLICNCSNQEEDDTNIQTGHWRQLSCDFFPLKKYNATKIYKFNGKEVSIINI